MCYNPYLRLGPPCSKPQMLNKKENIQQKKNLSRGDELAKKCRTNSLHNFLKVLIEVLSKDADRKSVV